MPHPEKTQPLSVHELARRADRMVCQLRVMDEVLAAQKGDHDNSRVFTRDLQERCLILESGKRMAIDRIDQVFERLKQGKSIDVVEELTLIKESLTGLSETRDP